MAVRVVAYSVECRVTRADGAKAPREIIAPHVVARQKETREGMQPDTGRRPPLLSWCEGQLHADDTDHQYAAAQGKPPSSALTTHNSVYASCAGGSRPYCSAQRPPLPRTTT